MKKVKVILAAALLLLILPILSWAGDSVVTVSYTSVNAEVSTIDWAWTAKTADGTVTDTACSSFKGWVFMATTDPGAVTPPQASYDIEIVDADGVDIFGAELNNRSQTASEHAVPKIGSSYYGARFINGTLTMKLTGNNVGDATGVVKIYYTRER